MLLVPLWAAGIYSSRESWDHSSVISVSGFTVGKNRKFQVNAAWFLEIWPGCSTKVQANLGPSAHSFWLRRPNVDSGMFLQGPATSPGFRASSRAGIRETSSSKQQSKTIQKGRAAIFGNFVHFWRYWTDAHHSSWSTEALAELEKTRVPNNLEERRASWCSKTVFSLIFASCLTMSHQSSHSLWISTDCRKAKASAVCDHTNS